MADISSYLAQIMAAVFGRDVRSSIHDAINAINEAQEVAIDSGTAIEAEDTTPSGDKYKNALYINTAKDQLLKFNGTKWALVGGIRGNGIREITGPVTSGLTDTYTVHYTDGTSYSFSINNGNKWHYGTDVNGKVAAGANFTLNYQVMTGDSYLNISEDAVYHCTAGAGANAQSTWAYDFTITSSSTGTNDYQMLLNRPQINGNILELNKTGVELGLSEDKWLMDSTQNPPVVLKKEMTVGSTSVTFTAAEIADPYTNGWALKAFFNVADGQPAPAFKKAILNSLTGDLTIYYTKVKSAQVGSGHECWCQLRIVK